MPLTKFRGRGAIDGRGTIGRSPALWPIDIRWWPDSRRAATVGPRPGPVH